MKAIKEQKRTRRHGRIRAKVAGDSARPRLSIYRSNKFIYAQLIDDEKGVTLASAKGEGNVAEAEKVGLGIAAEARKKKIGKAVFDRGGFLYAGRVKALADGARTGGLDF